MQFGSFDVTYYNSECSYINHYGPLKLELTEWPAAYTGPRDTIYSELNLSGTTNATLRFHNLVAGQYKFRIINTGSPDTISSQATIYGDELSNISSGYLDLFSINSAGHDECDKVQITVRNSPAVSFADNRLQDKINDYFDTGVSIDNGEPDWSYTDSLTTDDRSFIYTLPSDINTFCQAGHKLRFHLRLKGHDCVYSSLKTINQNIQFIFDGSGSSGCTEYPITLNMSKNTNIHCFPLTYAFYGVKQINKRDVDTILIRQETVITDEDVRDTIYVKYYNIDSTYYYCEVTDGNGFSKRATARNVTKICTTPTAFFTSSPYNTSGSDSITDDHTVYRSFSIYLGSATGFTTYGGCKYKFISGPEGCPPVNMPDSVYTIPAGTVLSNRTNWYPFSTRGATNIDYNFLPSGRYTFSYTIYDGSGYLEPDTVYYDLSNYRLKTPAIPVKSSETCNGTYFKITGGEMEEVKADSTVVPVNNNNYYISMQGPGAGATSIRAGDSILVTPSTAGLWNIFYHIIGYTYGRDTVSLKNTTFGIDLDNSSMYKCSGISGGSMLIKGQGGSGAYRYTLYDYQNRFVDRNNTGEFTFSGANPNYSILIEDTVCNISYIQPILVNDLNGITITYTNNADNIACLEDTMGISINCVSLGNTVYTWEGDGIDDTNRHLQRVRIPAANVGIGPHTYTMRVTPENCPQQITESITITVQTCSAGKESTLNGVQHNGFLGNPVTVLGNEEIVYKVFGMNVDYIIDTLPAYMTFTSVIPPTTQPTELPPTPIGEQVLKWNIANGRINKVDSVVFRAKPEAGICASQPLFINTATIVQRTGNVLKTNSTYHQGGGIAVVTFSAGMYGELFNDDPQAVDFKSTPESSILIVPDEGYEFAGWSHDAYYSMRDSLIPAAHGIMHLDTLTIYGDVRLKAEFVPEKIVANENVVETQNFVSLQQNKVWSSDNTLYVKAAKPGSIISIYNTAGVLIRQLTTVGDGVTEIRLSSGIYVVSVNGGIGKKVRVD